MIIKRREKTMNELIEILLLVMTEISKNVPPSQQQRHKQKLKHALKMVLLAWR